MILRLSVSLVIFLASAYADTLTLRNGTTLAGSWIGIDADSVRFQVKGETKSFPRSDVAKVTFGPAGATAKPELGMTISDVVAILGQPESVAEAGSKQIYSYKNSKVTFADGRVVDVQ